VTDARLVFDSSQFQGMIRELARRGANRRESGAFLLTDRNHPVDLLPQPVTAIAYYDDLAPGCLTGAITFRADGYTALAARCRRDRLRVVGDIHTHPSDRVAQSRTDAANPMIALDGHVALIAPRFATGVTDAGALGVHVRENGGWSSFFGPQSGALVRIRKHRRLRHRRALLLAHRLAAGWKRLRRNT
jgi:proteasome lid subunit RPN8/RPN11